MKNTNISKKTFKFFAFFSSLLLTWVLIVASACLLFLVNLRLLESTFDLLEPGINLTVPFSKLLSVSAIQQTPAL